jgi:hypothetical protein
VLRIFIALKNPSPCPGFEPVTFGSSGQHTNHYTTKATTSPSVSQNRHFGVNDEDETVIADTNGRNGYSLVDI